MTVWMMDASWPLLKSLVCCQSPVHCCLACQAPLLGEGGAPEHGAGSVQ